MMSQGQLEAIPEVIERAMTALELRVMEDVVERIKANGFVANTAENEIKRLQQLGMTTNQINQYLKDVLKVTDEELEEIFGEKLYEEYFGFQRGYEVLNVDFVPFEDNEELQMLIQAIKQQTKDELRNITNSLGFAIEEKGKVKSVKLTEFYQNTLDTAIYDIQTGVFDYNTVLKRTITAMTKSGLRSINYNSGRSDRIEVAARRAVMTGWRQVQGKINEQVAADLGTDTYEVSRHTGARPSHMVWQGKVWSKKELVSVCGLGEVTGLHGANCYHDYNAFIPGVSVRTYTDEELDRMNKSEMELKTYNGKSYDTYHALQHQRLLERRMRAQRQKISLLVSGGAAEDDILAARCRYQTQMQNYNDYIKKMELPSQMTRVYQDGLSKQRFLPTKKELEKYTKYCYHKNGTIVVTDDWKKYDKKPIPSKYKPYAVIETKETKSGKNYINRTFYDENGLMVKQIHTGNHGNQKQHNRGKNGEHKHLYGDWDTTGERLKPGYRIEKDLDDLDKKENGDIL